MMYKMCMLFNLSLSIKAFNDFADACGLSDKIIATDVITIKLTQTIPFIPTDETIARYEQIIKNGYESEKFICENYKFAGYEYIHPINDLTDVTEPDNPDKCGP